MILLFLLNIMRLSHSVSQSASHAVSTFPYRNSAAPAAIIENR